MKQTISLLLVLCMISSWIVPVSADNMDSSVDESVKESAPAESYAADSVLFALTDADVPEAALAGLGISQIEPVFTENGKAVGIGDEGGIWYRAKVSGDVRAAVDALTALDGVMLAEPEYYYTADSLGEPTEIECSKDWAYKKLHKHENKYWWKDHFGHDEAPGFGTVVAVIDTGVDYTHEDLAAGMWVNTAEMYGTAGVDDDGNGYIDDIHGVNVTAYGAAAGDPMDDNGHGTHVAGIIAMSANGTGGVGLAYGAKIMAVKAGQSTGSFASADIARAIVYAHMMGADVINMSFGGANRSELVAQALEAAFADCVLVASAGNDGQPTSDAPGNIYPQKRDIYPAGYSYVIGVMATDDKGNLASFSNWDYTMNANAEYELTAPGVGIHSTLPGNRYAEWNGTSMAAPFVSAAAAIIRSHYSDKAMYSSRFVMGQLVSATTDRTPFVSKDGKVYAYPALNVYDSVKYLPKPNITVKDTFLMDNKNSAYPTNDGDAIIDAGETIDLGVLVRNQWGLTGEITVKADAVSIGGVANPYITFITDTVTLQPAGTFAEVNNGFVYDDGYLTAVSNPIRFTVAADTPNDTEICINLTVTTTNGADLTDKAVYSPKEPPSHTFRVQAGRGIKGTISEDTTLTKDYLWIVENSVYIPEGVTLTVEPGTKIQFYSMDYESAYGGLTAARINNDGTLKMIGTEAEPIEMFPGKGFENYAVEIAGKGVETLKYCEIINPRLGAMNSDGSSAIINLINHCELVQNSLQVCYRKPYGGEIKEYFGSCVQAIRIKDSKFYGFDASTSAPEISAIQIDNCLFNESWIAFSSPEAVGSYDASFKNNVILTGTRQKNIYIRANGSKPAIREDMEYRDENKPVHTYEGANSKYVVIKDDRYLRGVGLDYYTSIASDLGGTIACINDAEEEDFFKEIFEYYDRIYSNYVNPNIFIGYYYDNDLSRWTWCDGSDYKIDVEDEFIKHHYQYPPNLRFVYGEIVSDGNVVYKTYDSLRYVMLEFPADLSDAEILAGIENFDYLGFDANLGCAYKNNAYINPMLNNNPDTWTKLIADSYNSDYLPNYATNNYWGTENDTLINLMITDADDFAGTYQDIIHDPILTLESESLSEIYPFVTKIYLADKDGNTVTDVQPGQTYSVHVLFNRDMDMTEQPSVTYGAASPYTDYSVHGEFISKREWVGETTISPVLNSGTMYWKTVGGRADDDHWLVCGEDVLRFSFNVSSIGALAMLLNAEGAPDKIILDWVQNDYDILAGYNLYRSTSPDGEFVKLNTAILTDTTYIDTDVEPGVTYYYYFKVVNTDGNVEGTASNIASAAPLDNIPPMLSHNLIKAAKMNTQITVSAYASDNIGMDTVTLYYRTVGSPAYQSRVMNNVQGELYVATIPAASVTAAGVEYYLTAADCDGNETNSGTALLPNQITVDSAPYISGFTPMRASIAGGETITILGGNFTEGMKLKIGNTEVTSLTLVNAGQLTFTAPALPGGSYALTLTTASGLTVPAVQPISYIDASGIAQIPTNMEMLTGVPYSIPFYATADSDVTALHFEVTLPTAYFGNVTVEKADPSSSVQMLHSYENGLLKVSCMDAKNFASEDPLLYITVTPATTAETLQAITLDEVRFNGVAVDRVIGGTALLKPVYTIEAEVKYYTGDQPALEGVTVTADGKTAVTDENGRAVLAVGNKTVTVRVVCDTPPAAVTGYDAALVLQSSVGLYTLNEYQKLAADVDGNGEINEYDASLILKKAVRKLDAFPAGAAWIFVPSHRELTLNSASNEVVFTAVCIGDVDGSYGDGAQ